MAPPAGRRGSDAYHEAHDKLLNTQLETFTRWWNGYLAARGEPVHDLCAQIKDGVLPFRLMEALEGFPAAPVVKGKMNIMGKPVIAKPKIKLQRTENLNHFVQLVTVDKGIKLVNIGAEDIEAGKVDLILGLTWELIKFYDLGGKNGAPLSHGTGDVQAAQAGVVSELMEWCKEQTKDLDGVTVQGPVTEVFKDGKVYAGMIASSRPDLIDPEDLEKMKAMVMHDLSNDWLLWLQRVRLPPPCLIEP